MSNENKKIENDNSKTRVRRMGAKKDKDIDDSANASSSQTVDNTVKSKPEKLYGNSSLSATIKTIVYITVVMVVSVFLSVVLIFAANDVFALRKPENEVVITVGDSPSVEVIADALGEKGVIKYPELLKLWAKVRNREGLNYKGGTYTVSPTMNYDQLLYAFVPEKSQRKEIRITIPEGYSVDEIIDLFVENGIGERDKFIDVINNYDFDYWFLKDLECHKDRLYRLEGYLYPDTYYFWSDSSEITAIRKLLDNFKAKVKKSWVKNCEARGMTLDEVLTLASIIQEEAFFSEDYLLISSVFNNRFASTEFDGLLQSDATIQYYYRHIYGAKKAPFTDEDRKFECPYNSYIYKGLPPGPLSTPTIDHINAALYPAESEYYYFITDLDGHALFAKTFEEHKMNIAAVEAGQNAADKNEEQGNESGSEEGKNGNGEENGSTQ